MLVCMKIHLRPGCAENAEFPLFILFLGSTIVVIHGHCSNTHDPRLTCFDRSVSVRNPSVQYWIDRPRLARQAHHLLLEIAPSRKALHPLVCSWRTWKNLVAHDLTKCFMVAYCLRHLTLISMETRTRSLLSLTGPSPVSAVLSLGIRVSVQNKLIVFSLRSDRINRFPIA